MAAAAQQANGNQTPPAFLERHEWEAAVLASSSQKRSTSRFLHFLQSHSGYFSFMVLSFHG